jgi:hypothetical protein
MGRHTQLVHSMAHMREYYNLTTLHHYSRDDIMEILDSYFNFIVVRHPFDRLVSGYKDKLAGVNHIFEHSLGSKILGLLRPDEDPAKIKLGKGVTFREFVQYLNIYGERNQHFRVYQDMCHPCLINYDYVVKLETQGNDADYLINEKLSGYGSHRTLNQHSTRGGAADYFSGWKSLPEFDNVTAEGVEELVGVYEQDIHMFGYAVQRQNGHVGIKCGEDSCC